MLDVRSIRTIMAAAFENIGQIGPQTGMMLSRSTFSATAVLTFLALAIVAFQVSYSWVGFIESDDLFYARTAEAWATHGGHLANSHWGLRHTIVLPLAGLFAVFGTSESWLVTVSASYLLGLLGLLYYAARSVAGPISGLVAVVLAISVPVIAESASLLTADVPEAVFVLGSVIVFHRASQPRRPWLFFFSGLLAGLAALTRETTVCLLAFYLILFLANYGRDRLAFVWMGVGFVMITVPDWLGLLIASGDPIYRLHVLFPAVTEGDSALVEGRNFVSNGLDRHGLLAAPRWLQALLMMFANQKIGPLLWLAVPAAVMVTRNAKSDAELALPRLLALLALTWFVGLSYVLQNLFLVPRYQIVSVAALAVCLAVWLVRAVVPHHRNIAVAAIAAVLFAGVGLISLSDRQLMFSERYLASTLRNHPGEFWTDPSTYRGAQWLLTNDGTISRVRVGSPPPGANYVLSEMPRRPFPADWELKTAPADWHVVELHEEAVRPPVLILQAIGLWNLVPEMVARKIAPTRRRSYILRVPPA